MANPHREAYEAMKADDAQTQRCRVCGVSGSKDYLDRHHPRGRSGENILIYFYVHRIPCHKHIHDNPKWAEANNFLEPNR